MIERFSQVFKEIEREMGTRDLTILVLRALKDAARFYKGKTIERFFSQMQDLVHIMNNTEPRIAIIIYSFYRIYEKLYVLEERAKSKKQHQYSFCRRQIIQIIDGLIKTMKKEKQDLFHTVSKLDLSGKRILIHDHSHTVQDVLYYLWKKKQKFTVIVAEQDMEKSLSNIETLSERGIPFQVVPAHMLSNIEDEIDICFFGALTLKSTYDFVVDTGTNAVIAEFRLRKKPIYIFLTTSKFSLWKARKKEAIHKVVHMRKHPFKEIHFERFKFSYDRVPLSSVDLTITNEGIFDQVELKRLYKKKFEEHALLTKKFGKI